MPLLQRWCISFLLPHNILPHTEAAQNNTHLLSHTFCGSGMWAWWNRVPCSGPHKAKIKLLAGLHFHLDNHVGEEPLLNSFRLLAEFTSLWR